MVGGCIALYCNLHFDNCYNIALTTTLAPLFLDILKIPDRFPGYYYYPEILKFSLF